MRSYPRWEQVEEESDQWDLYWTDLSVSMERVARLEPFQCINHFPGMMEICRKVSHPSCDSEQNTTRQSRPRHITQVHMQHTIHLARAAAHLHILVR